MIAKDTHQNNDFALQERRKYGYASGHCAQSSHYTIYRNQSTAMAPPLRPFAQQPNSLGLGAILLRVLGSLGCGLILVRTDGSCPTHCHRTRNDGMLMVKSHACTHSNIIPSAVLFKRAVGKAQIRTEFLCWACRMQAWWSPRYRIKPISLFWRDVFYLASCWCLRIF